MTSTPGDLRDVGAGQDHRDQLNEGQNDPNDGIADHHRHHVGLQLVLEQGQAAIDEDSVNNLLTRLKNVFCQWYSKLISFSQVLYL
jgi:hypothetical protein